MTTAKAILASITLAIPMSLLVAFGDEGKAGLVLLATLREAVQIVWEYEPFVLDPGFQTAARRGSADAMNSAARSPIIRTVAWLPPDRVTRGITDASTTDSPDTPLTLQY